jgi:drug/metabolite transporter (DMT)-like permease
LLASLLALGSATMYGASDFLGGLAARRADTVAVVVVSQFSGMVVLALILPFLPVAAPAARDLMWGVVAGITIGGGLGLLYRALAIGRMAVVAPTTAVCAVLIPLIAAILLGERPGPRTLLGIGLAIGSIVLVSQGSTRSTARSKDAAASAPSGSAGLGLALLAGVAIGVFFVSLARAAATAGLWPLFVARLASVAMFGAFALAGGRSLRMTTPVAVIAVVGGVIDMIANALYLLATHNGPLSVVVTLASLYPASTVVLALAVLGERLSARQGLGIVCALGAVFLIVGR